MTSPWLEARNILAVRLDNAGDVVMLGPALRAVKAASPAARLTLLATPAGAAVAPLLPDVNDVVVHSPVWQDIGGRAWDPAGDRALVETLAGRGFDAALVFTSFRQSPHAPGYVCHLAGVPLRAGETREFGGAVLTDELPSVPDDVHQVDRNLGLVERLGFPAGDRGLRLAVTYDDRAAAEAALRAAGVAPGRPLALLHPGASAAARRYPAERYPEVGRALAAEGWAVVVTGSAREAATVEAASGRGALPALTGATSLGQLAALVELADVVVCGNTLPLHLAEAMGTPVVCLYAGTDLESQWRPREVPHRLLRVPTACAPCYLFACPIGLPCLDVPAATVVEAVREVAGSAATAGEAARVPTEEPAVGGAGRAGAPAPTPVGVIPPRDERRSWETVVSVGASR